MIARILGVIDLTAVLMIILMHFDIFLGWRLLLFHVAFLVVKGAIFWSDWNSYMDMAIGLYLILMGFGVVTFLDWIAAIYLAQKGIASLM